MSERLINRQFKSSRLAESVSYQAILYTAEWLVCWSGLTSECDKRCGSQQSASVCNCLRHCGPGDGGL